MMTPMMMIQFLNADNGVGPKSNLVGVGLGAKRTGERIESAGTIFW